MLLKPPGAPLTASSQIRKTTVGLESNSCWRVVHTTYFYCWNDQPCARESFLGICRGALNMRELDNSQSHPQSETPPATRFPDRCTRSHSCCKDYTGRGSYCTLRHEIRTSGYSLGSCCRSACGRGGAHVESWYPRDTFLECSVRDPHLGTLVSLILVPFLRCTTSFVYLA